MAQRDKESGRPEHKSNLALRQVRKATGLSQGKFAQMIGVSPAYVQAVELGQRPASQKFAEKVRAKTGVWPRCLLESRETAVDVDGNPYTVDTYSRMQSNAPEAIPSDEDWRKLMEPLAMVIKGAAGVGKTSLAMSVVRDKLREAAERILVFEGVSDALIFQRATAGKLTVGQLRKQPELVALVGFQDDSTRQDNDEIVLHHVSSPPVTVDDLLKNFVPMCADCLRPKAASTTGHLVGRKRKSALA